MWGNVGDRRDVRAKVIGAAVAVEHIVVEPLGQEDGVDLESTDVELSRALQFTTGWRRCRGW